MRELIVENDRVRGEARAGAQGSRVAS